jgi:hypothetical protein
MQGGGGSDNARVSFAYKTARRNARVSTRREKRSLLVLTINNF